MNVADIHPRFASLMRDVGAETLTEHSFASANVASYEDSLSHFCWKLQYETEKFHQQAQFLVSVGKPARYIRNIEFCFVLEHALVLWHLANPR
jgi:hypothetical protein